MWFNHYVSWEPIQAWRFNGPMSMIYLQSVLWDIRNQFLNKCTCCFRDIFKGFREPSDPKVVSPISIFKLIYFCHSHLKLVLQILDMICVLVCSGNFIIQFIFNDFYAGP